MYSITQEEFKSRRQKFMDAVGSEGVAIFVAPPGRQRSHDTHYAYRPSSDILYLSGFREEETVLVIAPGHPEGEFVLFVRDRDPFGEMWEGRRSGTEGAMRDYGANASYTIGQLDEMLPKYLSGRKSLYYTLGKDTQFDARITGWINTLRHRRNAPPIAPAAIIDARDIIHEQRLFKTDVEIDRMRKAAIISAQAHELAMKHCKPGMHEYELQALIEYHFRKNGGEYPAYTTIVGGGANATILHYTENRDPLRDGDVVLIDSGCEYEFYAADITRSFPVSGKFTAAQRDIYQAVLETLVDTTNLIKPGLPYDELQNHAARQLTEALVQLGLLKGAVEELVEQKDYKKYYPHNIGHWLGIDVHDVGNYTDDLGNYRILEPRMVLTIEPGIYIPAEDENAPKEMRGIGIRLEDDILVTDNGFENLTETCRKSVDAIESLVGTA